MNEDKTESQETPKDKTPADIFHWANQTDSVKDKLDIQLYVFSKNYTVYAMNYADALKQQLKVLFVYDMVNEVQTGAAMGLRVKLIEEADTEDVTLSRARVEEVQHAQEVLEQIVHSPEQIAVFSEADHELKRIKGVVARCTYKDSDPFFVVKILPQSQVLQSSTAWMLSEGSFQPFSAEAGLRIAPDNQVLIVGDDIFAFSESKFERLFGYNAKKRAVAEEKVAAIEAAYSLSMPEGVSLMEMISEKNVLITKLQKTDTENLAPVDKLLEQADSMEIEIMQDDAGAIILMDTTEAAQFITLISDDYLVSDMTGHKYEVKSKKRLDEDPEPGQPKPPAGLS